VSISTASKHVRRYLSDRSQLHGDCGAGPLVFEICRDGPERRAPSLRSLRLQPTSAIRTAFESFYASASTNPQRSGALSVPAHPARLADRPGGTSGLVGGRRFGTDESTSSIALVYSFPTLLAGNVARPTRTH